MVFSSGGGKFKVLKLENLELMKRITNVNPLFLLLIIIILPVLTFSQGNSNGNSNVNNNSNVNTLKWETQGNNADTTDFIGTTNQTALKIRTNNQERMRITPDGKIGIGVSNPLEKFELQGNLKINGDVIFSNYADITDTLGKFIFIDEVGRTSPRTLNQLKSLLYTTPIGPCELVGNAQNPTWANGPNKIFVECPQVNVGIGLNNPTFPLEVVGKTKTSLLQVGSNNSQTALITGFRNGVSNATLLSLGQKNQAGEFIAMTVESFGKLSLFNAQENGQMLQFRNEIWGKDVLTFDNHGNLRISNNNRTLLFMDAQQETFFTRRIVVDQEVWPDYVFKKDYKLMSLDDVNTFISENGHLPNVPSEKEITENGSDLGEMNRILLEKIEELTLYTISQQKEIEALKEQFNQIIGQ